jgi:hypothetical protein
MKETAMRERRTIVVGCLCAVLAACGGGSGSTGLVTSEDAVIDQVRETGTCHEFDGAPYCATDSPNATAPGGQRVSVVTPAPTALPTSVPTPAPTATSGSIGSATPQAAPTPTPGGAPEPTDTAAAPSPARTATPAPVPTATAIEPVPTTTPSTARTVTLVVDGFEPGAACATAARPAGSADVWRTAALVPVDVAGAPTTFPIAADVAAPLDLTLLCFADPPAALPSTLATLAAADPTVVFVLPSP